MDEARYLVADILFANVEFGGWQVKDTDGWEWADDKAVRTVYFEPNCEGPSVKGTVTVEFDPESATVQDAYLDVPKERISILQ